MIESSTIDAARGTLDGVAVRTPVLELRSLGRLAGVRLHAKAEHLQETGSFKFRGAYNALASLTPEQRARGVVTYSSGNHGQGLAAAARAFGTSAVIFMPEDAATTKIEGVKHYGGMPRIAASIPSGREVEAIKYAQRHGQALVPPADDPSVMAGQATIGAEILEQVPDVEVVVVPVGGGGLICGIGSALKHARPDVRVIGVEPEGKAAAFMSFKAGHRVRLESVETAVDGLRGDVIGPLAWEIMPTVVDEIVLVGDDWIMDAVRLLARSEKQIVELAGAVSLAAVLAGVAEIDDANVVIVLSGGNIDPALAAGLIASPSSMQSAPRREADPA